MNYIHIWLTLLYKDLEGNAPWHKLKRISNWSWYDIDPEVYIFVKYLTFMISNLKKIRNLVR